MKKKEKQEKTAAAASGEAGLFKGVFAAYSVLLLHAALAVILGLVVIFFSGVIHYMAWILLGGFIIIGLSAWYSIRKLKQHQQSLAKILSLPEFSGTSLEIRLLGGLASLKMSKDRNDQNHNQQGMLPGSSALLLDSPDSARLKTLAELGRMYENGLITRMEYLKAKEELLGNQAKQQETKAIDISPSEISEKTEEDEYRI